MPRKPVRTIEWTGRAARIIDQTLLPSKVRYLNIRTAEAMWEAIRALRVRGAPAIGVAAGYGVYLGAASAKPKTAAQARTAALEAADYLATSRPTAVNLFWALEECRRALARGPELTTARGVLARLMETAIAIHSDDEARCEAIARHGASLLKGVSGIITHCNAGALATAGVGTAVGVILEAAKTSKFTVYADETRPLLQGARLTAFELSQAGVDHRVITDSMAGSVLARGWAQAVIVGADRIAANGDAANKIGTMPLAICARHFGVPFYVAAPVSTIDFAIPSGARIPIEERDEAEVLGFAGTRTAPKGARAFNPAFDVTPARLITAIITERGVVRAPYKAGLARLRHLG